MSARLVRGLHETAPHGYTDGYTDGGLLVTRALQPRKMNFYAAREENPLFSRGKYIFLGREKITPPCGLRTGYTGYTVTRLHGGMLHLCIFPLK